MKRGISFIVAFFLMLFVLPFPSLHAGDTITVTTDAQLLDALSNPAYTNIISQGALANLNFTVRAGVTLTLNIGAYPTVKSGVLTNNGNVIINLSGYIVNYNEIKNYGTITLTGRFYNTKLAGWGTGLINNYSGATFTITSGSKLDNSDGATINNYGTFKFDGEYTGSGEFNNYGGGETEQSVELLKDGVKVGSYTKLEDALTAANLSGCNYEIHVCTDITLDCTLVPPYNTPPMYPLVPNVTISGKKSDGSLSTITFSGGNYNPSVYVILKDINIACSTEYKVFSNNFGLQGEVHLPSATYSTVTVSGSGASTDGLSCTTLNLASGAAFTVNSVTATNITLNSSASLNASTVTSSNSLSLANSSKLTVDTVSAKNLTLNGGKIVVNKNGFLNINGTVSGSGGTAVLPLPSDHSGVTSSMTFATDSSVGSSTKITVQPADGVTIPNNSKLILLKSPIELARFGYSDPLQIFKQSTLEGLTYLTLRDAPYPTTLAQEPVAPITYGEGATVTVSASRTSGSEQIPGTVNFYKGSSEIAGNLIATVALSGGRAACSLTAAQLDQIGSNQFLAVYTDPDNIYASSTVVCIINVNAKELSITGVDVSSKNYDGKTDAQLNSITLSGIMGSDNVTASAVAAFSDPGVGSNKKVNLTSINLKGAAASHYLISAKADNLPTEASIYKAIPSLNIMASPDTDLAPGENVVITANLTGAPDGNSPSGSIVLKDGESIVGAADLTASTAHFTWNPATEGLHNLSAEYSGDVCYTAVSQSITLDFAKRMQAALTVAGIPASITYGDSEFSLTATGGSGSGALSYTVASGSSVSVDHHGTVSINSAGTSEITVTKAGNVTYNGVSTTVTIVVDQAVPTLAMPPEASRVYRTHTLSESVISSGRVTGALGETLEGVFLWKDTGSPVTAEGSFDAVFVPNSGNYSSLPLKINVGLKKAIPIISKAPSASKVDAGNKLSKSILSGGSAIGLDNIILTGTFTWENPDEKVIGTAKHHAVFTPDNTEDYETVLFDILVGVNDQNNPTTDNQKNSNGNSSDADIHIYETGVWVNMDDYTTVTSLQMAELAEYNKEKPVVFSGANYSFTFEKGALRSGIAAYDFGISLRYGQSPNAYIDKLAGDKLVLTADYSHSGNLPGKATIRFYVGTRYAGKTLYYYLYNPENNRLEYMQATAIHADGYAEIVQQHCSTYILTSQRLNTLVEIPETGIGKQSALSGIYQLLQVVFGCAI